MKNDSAYVRFVRELIRQLPALRERAGAGWPEIADRIEPLFLELAEADSPAVLHRLAGELLLAFHHTEMAADVEMIWFSSMASRFHPPFRPRWLGFSRRLWKVSTGLSLMARAEVSLSQRPIVLPGLQELYHHVPDLFESVRLPISLPPPPPPPPQEEVFHYVLKGDKVEGSRMLVSSKARLVFQFAVPAGDEIAVVRHHSLDAARVDGIEMQLVATATGAVQIEGSRVGVTRFDNGRMVEPIVFSLAASEDAGAATIQVDYYLRGVRVHQSEIALEVVTALARDQHRRPSTLGHLPIGFPQTIANARPKKERTILLTLSMESGRVLSINLLDLVNGKRNSEQQYVSKLERGQIDAMLKSVQAALGPIYAHEDAWRQIGGKADPAVEPEELRQVLASTLETVALAGSRLNRGLREDGEIAKALDYIEKNLADGGGLSISTNDIFLPWEILYPKTRHPNPGEAERASNPVEPGMFWGARFAIDTDQRGEWELASRSEQHLMHGPKVSINVDPDITVDGLDDFKSGPIHQEWANTLAPLGVLDGIQASCQTIQPVLFEAASNASLIYLFCHGAPADASAGVPPLIYLCGDQCKAEPADFDGRVPFRNAPIIFLNSCYAGAGSPFITERFLREFRKLGALGMIATSFEVPVVFASGFANEVVNAYIRRKGSLAQEMLRLRRDYLDVMNPVPLLYTLQCSLDEPFPSEGGQHA
jgi:hypothetical protein